jgi:hypothetical protein
MAQTLGYEFKGQGDCSEEVVRVEPHIKVYVRSDIIGREARSLGLTTGHAAQAIG